MRFPSSALSEGGPWSSQVLNSFIECARLHSSKTARAIADTAPDNSGERPSVRRRRGIAGETLSRVFTLPVFVIPGLLIAPISLHLRLVLTKGINEYPVPGQEVRKETYRDEYEALLQKEGVPFYPKAIGKDVVFSALVVLGILFCCLCL